MTERKFQRREFLKVSGLGLLGAVAAACAPAATEAPPPAATQTPVVIVEEKTVVEEVIITATPPPPPSSFSESPMLKDMGLPPVDERLPEAPVVVGGRDEVGVYGGEVRMIHYDPVWMVSNYDWMSERMLHYSDIDLRTLVPNVFESWEVSPDGKEFSIKMRKGMKWSDGEPITSEDVRFVIEDVWFNTDLNGAPMWQLRFDGGANTTPAKFELIDDFSFKLTYAAPFGALPAHLTRWEVCNWPGILGPSHYYKQYHNKYTDQAKLDEMAVAAGVETWVQLYNQRCGPSQWGLGYWQVPAWMSETFYPTLSPWIFKEDKGNGLFLFERNPYYWKVDLVGQQLPYFDSMRFDYITTTENAKLRLAQNEVDAMGQHDVTMADYPFYKENEVAGNFKVMDYISCMADREVFFPQHVIFLEDGTTRIRRWKRLLTTRTG